MTQISLTRDQLLERLAAQRKLAVSFDVERLKEHRQDEKDYLAEFKANCREALKWDYATAKTKNFSVSPRQNERRWGSPQCPISLVKSIDQAVKIVELSNRTRYNISSSGIHSTLHRLVTWNPDADTNGNLC